MLRILKGMVSKAAASSAMQSGLAGGFWFKRAPRNALMPYVIIEPGDSASIDYETSKRYVEPVNYKVAVVGKRISDIASIVAAWRDGFNYQNVTLDEGHVMACQLTDEEQLDESPLEETRECIQHVLNFEFRQQQAHA
jgi:hypothetical protein